MFLKPKPLVNQFNDKSSLYSNLTLKHQKNKLRLLPRNQQTFPA